MQGVPKFGKNWLDNFIPNEEMQNTFITSEVVRNVLMLQCIFLANVYNELLSYKLKFLSNELKSQQEGKQVDESQGGFVEMEQNFKVGIIGCGQLGTMLLTKLLETQSKYLFIFRPV